MHQVVSEKPYRFVPPYHGRFWATLLQLYLRRYLDRTWGIASVECRGTDRLRRSLAAGHGILLAPNHPRDCDPLVLGALSREVRWPFFAVASWHLFMHGGPRAWLLRRMGAFSIYREGMDRQALNAAIDILEHARRPLVIFPEGAISRTNDRLNALMDGVGLIARTAARKRAKATPAGNVVVHPVALKYFFEGDLERTAGAVLDDIEARLTWQRRPGTPLVERIVTVGSALLSLKEIEHLGAPQTGDLWDRLARLIDALLVPLEQEWLGGERESTVVARVKRLRSAILPDLVKGDIPEDEKDRRWRQLADCYLAQQLSFYPPDYIRSCPSAERILETVERFEEDLTDKARPHRPMRVVIEVGEAIDVSPERDRKAETDPLIEELEACLRTMLASLADEGRRSP
jgi:1-acyl-sn-glycerol-3-phosphate acyltransferase